MVKTTLAVPKVKPQSANRLQHTNRSAVKIHRGNVSYEIAKINLKP